MLHALQRYLKFFAVLGLVPWTKKAPQQHLQKIYTIAIISVNIGVAIYIVLYAPPEGDLLVSTLVSCIVFITQIVTMSVIEIQACQYNRYYEFCLQLKCLRLRFQCELQQPTKSLPFFRYVKYFVLAIFNVITVFPSIYVVLHYDYIGYFWYSLSPVLINRFQCLLLLLYAELLGYHAELLDQRLRAVHKYRPLGVNPVTLDLKFEQMCSLEYLLGLKRAYMELYQLFGQFNGLYGWSIVCIFVVMFLDSMINIYWSLLVLTGIYSFAFIYMACSTFVPLLVMLFTFCRCGEYCKRQHMLIGSHVRGLACAVQCQTAPPPPAYNAVLAEFAMQVEQDALIISAEGFMDIDYSLLMSILTAMVTYLIVLMQFGALYT